MSVFVILEIILSGLLILTIITITQLHKITKRLKKNKTVDNNELYKIQLEHQYIKALLVLAGIAIVFFGFNVQEKAVNEVKEEIFKEFDSVLNFYIAETEIEMTKVDTVYGIPFNEMLPISSKTIPIFYRKPFVFIQSDPYIFTIEKITKNYVDIKWFWQYEGPTIDKMGIDLPKKSKINFWIVEKE